VYSSLRKPISELQSVTCHMGSHSVSCHQTQVNTTCHKPRWAGREEKVEYFYVCV